MTRFYWMPLPLPDFFADTAMLTADERGAFIYIMAAVWRSRDGWIADNDRDLAHFTATGDRWPRVKARIAPLLTFESGGITHEAIRVERLKAEAVSQKRRSASRVRWSKNKRLRDANGNAIGITDTDTVTSTEVEAFSRREEE